MLLKVTSQKYVQVRIKMNSYLDILNLQKDSDALQWKSFLCKFEVAVELQMGSLTHEGNRTN